MSFRYKGARISATPPTVNVTQAKGIWTLEEEFQSIAYVGWPPSGLNIYYLVAGGGAGSTGGVGGVNYGSGGGSGIVRTSLTTISTGTNYTVTIGAGGTGVPTGTAGNGGSSVFSSVTATGGNGVSNTSRTGGSNADYAGGTDSSGVNSGGGAGSASAGSLSFGGSATTTILRVTSENYGKGGDGQPGAGGFAVAGAANSGNGAGGTSVGSSLNGGSGVVILTYSKSLTISNPGGGLTFSTTTTGDASITTFTAGTGSVQFA